MKHLKNKSTAVLTFLALAFIFSLSSCTKKQVKTDIQGIWSVQEFLVDGAIFFQPSTNNSIVWTIDDETISNVTTYLDGNQVVTETDSPTNYKIKNGGETLWAEPGDEWTIVKIDASTMELTAEFGEGVANITFTK